MGWDGADWKLITPLLDRGLLPNLAALINRGVMGKLSTLSPMVSPLLWTSLATGKRADKHGILVRAEFDAEVGALQPISGASRATATVWEILQAQGIPGHVINWPASHPAEGVNGVVVSDRYPRVAASFDEPWPVQPGTIAPACVEEALAELRVHPAELPGEQLLAFIPELARIDQHTDPRVLAVAEVVAETVSVHAATTWAMASEPWEFVAVHYGGLEQLGHRFMRYEPPRLAHVSEDDFELYRDVMTGAYCFHDVMLGRLMELAGDDCTVLLVSDHGFCTGAFRPQGTQPDTSLQWHRGTGVFCLAGEGIRQDELLHQVGILDVAPTILTLFGLAVGNDMEGRPLLAAWTTPPVALRTPSWDEILGPRTPTVTTTAGAPLEALAELDAFGYADALLPIHDYLERTVRNVETYNLALVHRAAGRPDQAISLLQQLLDEEPDNSAVKLYLASCHYQVGQYASSREVLAGMAVADDEGGSKERDLLTALLLIAENEPQAAIDRLNVARQTHSREPRIFCYLGRAYLRLRRPVEAEAAFTQAVAIDEDCVSARIGLAVVYVHQRRWEEVADEALTVVGLDHHHHEAHYLLGVALFHLRHPARAIQAFETALSIRHEWEAARLWLTTLRENAVRLPLAELSSR